MTVASLNARLLARKGDARPAPIDTPSEFGQGRARPSNPYTHVGRPAGQAWPAPFAVCEGPADCDASAGDPGAGDPGAGDPGAGDPSSRARVSLRLNSDRHRRLRLAAIHLDASLQQILTHALDRYLAQVAPDCACMSQGIGRSCVAPAGTGRQTEASQTGASQTEAPKTDTPETGAPETGTRGMGQRV